MQQLPINWLNCNKTIQYKSTAQKSRVIAKNNQHLLAKSRGFQLPIVLIILVAIVVSSTFLLNSVIQSQKQVQANLELLRAELSAHKAIAYAENAIDNFPHLPIPSHQLEIQKKDKFDFSNGHVLVANLEDYDLITAKDKLTGQALNWWDQGEKWWQTYAYAIDPNNTEAGYYVIEWLSDIAVGHDYGQDKDYKGGGIRLLYRITARGKSTRGSAHLKQTSYVRVYPSE